VSTIVQDVIAACRGAGFEVRDALGGGHPLAVTGSIDSAALLLEQAMTFELPLAAQVARDDTYLFERWAKDPVRAEKIPLARHANGVYADTRSYLIRYGWQARAQHHIALFKRPEGLPPFGDPSPAAKAASYERLRLAACVQQPEPVPHDMALVWRSDLIRMRADLTRYKAFFDMHQAAKTPQEEQAP